MATDLEIRVEDRPGAGARVLEAVGAAGINVEGACGVVSAGTATMHICVEDPEGARRALEGAGISVERQLDALVVAVENTPGSGGRLLRSVAEAGVNLEAVYLATNTRVVLAGANVEAARNQLQAGVGAPEAST